MVNVWNCFQKLYYYKNFTMKTLILNYYYTIRKIQQQKPLLDFNYKTGIKFYNLAPFGTTVIPPGET